MPATGSTNYAGRVRTRTLSVRVPVFRRPPSGVIGEHWGSRVNSPSLRSTLRVA
jgi:hypothetical protein